LRFNLPRSDSTILFVGFQAQGTLGRTIVDGAKRVRISGRDAAVRARIRRIDSYSAHADRSELLAWIEARQPIRGSLFLTHGEESAVRALGKDLESRTSQVIIPAIGERYELPRGAPARRLATGRTDLGDALTRDWQNDYADLMVNLKRRLQAIESPGKRREALARMREVVDDYAAHRERPDRSGRRRPG
jgi:metallo-beta-lactamase family protein